MKDKHNITIRLAGFSPLTMYNISPEEEEILRKAERNVNDLWNAWSRRFNDKSAGEVMAMVAFRFAELYTGLLEENSKTAKALASLEEELDDIVHGESLKG